MQNAETVLDVLRERGRRGLPCTELYRQLFNPSLYLMAYGRLYSNHGAMTPGADGETADGMSMGKIDRIIDAMRHERYRFLPARRVYIPKKQGTKMRPLGLPSWADKLVGEVVRLLLEAYYEPRFSPRSHGFRPGRGCHTALTEVANHWTGTTWFIEGDIADCFGSFDHDVMLSILAEHVHDGRFLRLVRSMPMPAGVDRSASRTPRPRRTAAASSRPGPGGCLEFRHLPRLVAEVDYQELIEPWLCTPPGLSGRRYAALALARLCGARTWPQAGLALGWAAGRGSAVAEYVCEFVVDPAGFWQAVTELADRLQARGPIDYDRRRQSLSTLVSIDVAVWGPVFAAHGGRLMPAGCRAATVWLWTMLTCGERGDAPALLDPGWSAVCLKSRLRTCRNLSVWLPDALADKLLRFGETLLESHGVR
jgi:hypothetical protein